MSMIYCLVQMSEQKVEQLIEHPERIYPLLGIRVEPRKSTARTGIIGKLFGRSQPVSSEPDVTPIDFNNDGLPIIDIEKSWHGIHYLLTGTDWEGELPRAYLLSGGVEVGDIDVGYGPARAMRLSDVQAFDTLLQSVTSADTAAQFNANEMKAMDIYPFGGSESPGEGDLGYLIGYFEVLKSFVHDAATNGRGLVTYLS